MDAFQFIRDVAVDWDDTRILEAEPGAYLTIARKAKHKDEWYIGAITGENARTATIPLDYLPPNCQYVARVYADAADAHWKDNPMAYEIKSYLVNSRTELKLALASGGGAAISVRRASADEAQHTKAY
jgi:hypothetical protein